MLSAIKIRIQIPYVPRLRRARIKTKLTGHAYEPRRAGQLNEETQYVLEKFAVKPPKLLSDLREQIKDVEFRK